MRARRQATAFAPASVANVAVGFDLLGFSVNVAGDTVSIERIDEPRVEIVHVSGLITRLPTDSTKNTATAGLVRMIADLKIEFGFRVSIKKGIPLGSGMGGSAASAVAAVVAANELLDERLSEAEMLRYALIGEAEASGSFHADNIAPSLRGGLTFARVREADENEMPKVEIVSIPVPVGIHCVLVNPHLSVETKQARGILKKEVSLRDHIAQSANLIGFLAGCYQGDFALIRKSFEDLIIEPQRSHLIPGFNQVKAAAVSRGAMGCSISGAGPSVFAWAESESGAAEIRSAMVESFARAGVSASGWSMPLASDGAKVIA